MTTLLARRLSCVLVPLLLLGTGCNLFLPRPEAPIARGPRVPVGDTSSLTTERVVAYLNAQADRIQSIESTDVSLTARAQGNRPPSLDGSFMVQKPRYFRLTGKFLGSQEVLIGSNEERFWFYVPRGQDALFHCSYTDFEKGVELPFPFDPEWVLEALGMAQVTAEGARIDVDRKAQTVRFIQDATFHGQKVRKVTVCDLAPTVGDVPQIQSRTVYDTQGRVICTATIKSVSRFPVGRNTQGQTIYAAVPKVVKLEWPAQDTTLELDLGRMKINGQLPRTAFEMPRVGSRQVDLGRDRPTSRGVVPARFR